jgi:hypothetical protein
MDTRHTTAIFCAVNGTALRCIALAPAFTGSSASALATMGVPDAQRLALSLLDPELLFLGGNRRICGSLLKIFDERKA